MIDKNRNGRVQFYGLPTFGRIYRHGNDSYILMSASSDLATFSKNESEIVELFINKTKGGAKLEN